MRLLVDTNRYRDFCDGAEVAVDLFRRAEKIWLPFVVVAELRAGFACGTMSRRNEAVFQAFITRPRVGILFADEQTTHHFARLFRQLKVQGTPIPTHDLWIAALTLQHDLVLFSRDRHFKVLPQLPIMNNAD